MFRSILLRRCILHLSSDDPVANNAITSGKIRDGTITTADLADGLLPTFTVRYSEHREPIPPFTRKILLAGCNEAETPIGGGFNLNTGSTYGKITAAYLSLSPYPSNGYWVDAYNDDPLNTGTITAWAYCATTG